MAEKQHAIEVSRCPTYLPTSSGSSTPPLSILALVLALPAKSPLDEDGRIATARTGVEATGMAPLNEGTTIASDLVFQMVKTFSSFGLLDQRLAFDHITIFVVVHNYWMGWALLRMERI